MQALRKSVFYTKSEKKISKLSVLITNINIIFFLYKDDRSLEERGKWFSEDRTPALRESTFERKCVNQLDYFTTFYKKIKINKWSLYKNINVLF